MEPSGVSPGDIGRLRARGHSSQSRQLRSPPQTDRVNVDLSSHVVVVELEADATGETAYIIAGPVPMSIKPRGARWTPLFQPCRCRVLARRVLWNLRTLKVHNGELYMCNYCLAAHTTCHCVRPCCIWACTAARCVPLACARSAYRGI